MTHEEMVKKALKLFSEYSLDELLEERRFIAICYHESKNESVKRILYAKDQAAIASIIASIAALETKGE